MVSVNNLIIRGSVESVAKQMTQEALLPAPAQKKEVSFAEISFNQTENVSGNPCSGEQLIQPVAVVKANHFSSAISNDILESLRTRIP